MSKQQTAVEWLENQIISELDKSQDTKLGLYFIRFMELVNQAKAMEKQQIEKAWWAGHDERDGNEMIHPSEDCNQYYNQTYGTKNSD